MNFRIPGLAGPGVPAAGGGPSIGAVIVVALIGGGVAVVIVLLLMNSKYAVAARNRKWHPGPWPVDPAHIATRGELVRAFDYLALLLLGRRAEHYTYGAVAAEIGANASPQRSQAAAELARLYEQARYAPASEDLSPEDMRRARGNLTSLAGAAQA